MNTPADPRLQPQPKEPPQHARPGARRVAVWGGLLLGAAIAVAGGLGFHPFASSPAADTGLSSQEQAARVAQFAAAGAINVQLVPDVEVDRALDDIVLPPAEVSLLKRDLADGTTKLVYVTLWDDVAVDGDVVRLSSNGLSIDVPLTNVPVRVAIPAPPQGVVNLIGVRDGGGGITVAVLSGTAKVPLPSLAPGQKIGIPVRVP